MRVEVSPRHCSLIPGEPAVITVSVANTGMVISGHRVRVLGVDPAWVTIDQDQLSLFPDTSGACVVKVTLPKGVPAGSRSLAVEVTELTPPNETTVVNVALSVPAEPKLRMSLDPVSVTAGHRASVAVLLENTGNSVLDVVLDGRDETGEVRFAFDQSAPRVTPGEQRVGTASLRARRPWFGSPKIRPYSIIGGPPGAPVVAAGTWLQKPRFSRGAVALAGLLAAATVFAIVIAVALSQVVTTSNADRNLALQVAEAAQNGNANAGTAGISGTVLQQSTGNPVGAVTVDVFQSSNAGSPIVSTVTDAAGGYHFTGLAAGSYLLEFQGAGFASLWYPDSLTAAGATGVTVKAAQSVSGINIQLGGLPGSISGQIVGADPTGTVLTLEIPGSGGDSAAAAAAVNSVPAAIGSTPASTAATTTPTTTATTAPPTSTNPSTSDVSVPAAFTLPAAATTTTTTTTPVSSGSPSIVTSQAVSSNGTFTFANVPSPGTFDVVAVKAGYAPAVQQVNLSGGESRSGLVITLHKGDGSISGTVSTSTGPLGGATIAASDGSSTASTVSETTAGSVGDFELASLPTPDSLTVVISAPGYASQTLTLALAAHQQLTGVAVVLSAGTGSVAGTVTTGGQPAGGVTVTATNGQQTLSTVTLSIGSVGTYQLTGLTDPGDYTLTFSRPDLTSQTRAISLTSSNGTLTGIDPDLTSETAAVYGTITQTGGAAVHQVAVQLSAGSSTYQVVSADSPTPGAYEIDGIAPGTYTISFTRQGGQPVSSIVTLQAGQRFEYDPQLAPAASIYGRVVQESDPTQAVPNAQVTLYLADQYPTVSVAMVLTNSAGQFTFSNVDAPQNFVVGVAYPQGESNQETAVVQTTEGVSTPVCGSQSTGQVGAAPTTSTTAAPGATCNPTTDPLKVSTP